MSTSTSYYLDSETGDDANDGLSPATAWSSLAQANAARLEPGDRLLLRRGQTWTGQLAVHDDGLPRQRILIGAYGSGPLPTIQGGSTCVVLKGSYVRLTLVHLDGCRWAGVSIAGAFDRVDHTVIEHNAVGIEIRPEGRSDEVVLNELTTNDRMSVLTKTPTNDDSGAFGILLRGDGARVASNRISGSDAFSYDYGRDGSAIEVFGGRHNLIERNVAIDDQAFAELGNPRSDDNVFAYNLYASALRHATFLVTRGARENRGPVLHTRVYNNTASLTGSGSQGVVCYAGCTRDILTLRNNIVVASARAAYADAPFDEAADVFFGGPVVMPLGPGSIVADPRFRDAADADFHLLEGSPAIDRGLDLGFRLDLEGNRVSTDAANGRTAPDAGALEYQAR